MCDADKSWDFKANLDSYLARVRERIQGLTVEDLKDSPFEFDPEFHKDRDELSEVKEKLLSYLPHIEHSEDRRDCCWLTIGTSTVLLTGGMSWGDSPTEMYGMLQDLNSVNVL
jgi:hypothetical protein